MHDWFYALCAVPWAENFDRLFQGDKAYKDVAWDVVDLKMHAVQEGDG